MGDSGAQDLVATAITTSNTYEMNQIIERHEAAGRAFDDIDLARLSPVIHAHINLNGRYHIDPDHTRRPRTRARDALGIYR